MSATRVIAVQVGKVMEAIRLHEGVILRFQLSCSDVDVFEVTPSNAHIPHVVAHGTAADLETVLTGFAYWQKPIALYGLSQDGLTEFWVADQ